MEPLNALVTLANFVLIPATAYGALLLTAEPALAGPVSYVCEFYEECSRATCEQKQMNLTFFIEASGAGDAYMQGNVGLVRVFPVAGDSGISFIEPLTAGSVQSTTILTDGAAIHSRHTQLLGEFVPSQWFGTCNFFGGN
ncbi:hypothetical protein [Jannaschia sp. W003]|uniref:hypothetical protein n=1 Tax=Jannaschia sp. W003 TaxID=2867012 RepID=UPI0021A3E132|nr:hypothetical protein [Jannaschia sp. W003]UWQ20679.1 hypothetical protein K3554_11895 [Jannaschia sp. W003]